MFKDFRSSISKCSHQVACGMARCLVVIGVRKNEDRQGKISGTRGELQKNISKFIGGAKYIEKQRECHFNLLHEKIES